MPTVTISLRLDEKLKRDLSAWCEFEGHSVNDSIVKLIKQSLDSAQQSLAEDLEFAKSELKEWHAILMKIVDKVPGAKVVLDDFVEGEPGYEKVKFITGIDERYAEDSEDLIDGIPRDVAEDSFDHAKFWLDRRMKCREIWADDSLPNEDLVDERSYPSARSGTGRR